ncbi:MAG: hypothetical protein QME96_05875, partial [Myxococcota bacterium]|nr:hypothetical protein [Myxococcota bacterium]
LDRGYCRDEAIHGHESVGPAPTELRVRLLFSEPHQNLVTHLGCHDGKRWVCQGNGETALELNPDGSQVERSCTCPRLGADPRSGPVCKPRGVLSVVLEASEEWGTVHVFKTTSWESIANLRTQLELFHQQFGTVAWLPLILKVYPATKSYQGAGNDDGGTTTQPIVTLALEGSLEYAQQIAAGVAQEWRQAKLLAGAVGNPEAHVELLSREMAEEAEEEGREFHPEAATRPAASDPVPQGSLQERLAARKASQPLPVVQAPQPQAAQEASGPDYELVGEGEEGLPFDETPVETEIQVPEPSPTLPGAQDEPRGMRTGKTKAELNRAYFAKLGEAKPGWGSAERKIWQQQRVGKSSCSAWTVDDYELALALIDRGLLDYQEPERTTAETVGAR